MFLMLKMDTSIKSPQLLVFRCFSNALVDRFEIQGCNLRQCHSAPKPELLSFDPDGFQRWLADELKIVVIPKELANLIEQGASLNIQSPSVRDVLQGFGQLPDKHAKLACKWLFEGRMGRKHNPGCLEFTENSTEHGLWVSGHYRHLLLREIFVQSFSRCGANHTTLVLLV